jgi:TPR repeat protein
MAQYNLALIYLEGRGRPTDETKAFEWMQKAATQNLPAAEYDLGGFYQFGRGVTKDRAKAAEWTGKAAEAGVPEAQVEYGVMLFKGEGVAVDEQRAVAQNRLARLYANGVAVGPADPVQAAKWHLLAREAGVADFSLDILLAKLTPEQRAAADKAAKDWRDGHLSE